MCDSDINVEEQRRNIAQRKYVCDTNGQKPLCIVKGKEPRQETSKANEIVKSKGTSNCFSRCRVLSKGF